MLKPPLICIPLDILDGRVRQKRTFFALYSPSKPASPQTLSHNFTPIRFR